MGCQKSLIGQGSDEFIKLMQLIFVIEKFNTKSKLDLHMIFALCLLWRLDIYLLR